VDGCEHGGVCHTRSSGYERTRGITEKRHKEEEREKSATVPRNRRKNSLGREGNPEIKKKKTKGNGYFSFISREVLGDLGTDKSESGRGWWNRIGRGEGIE
jgi:hypothetical protein